MSELQLTGRLYKVLPELSGVSKSGKDWKKKDFCIETEEQYSKKVCFTLFGEKVSYVDKFTIGDMLDVKFNVESNEGTNDRWFSNINAYSVQKVSGTEKTSEVLPVYESPVKGNNLPPTEHAFTDNQPNEPDDLPF